MHRVILKIFSHFNTITFRFSFQILSCCLRCLVFNKIIPRLNPYLLSMKIRFKPRSILPIYLSLTKILHELVPSIVFYYAINLGRFFYFVDYYSKLNIKIYVYNYYLIDHILNFQFHGN